MKFINRNPKIYVLSGKASSGKNLTASLMTDIYFKKNKNAISLAYASYLKEYAKNVLKWDGEEKTKPREFLQQVGVELIKKQIDSNMLINRILEDIKVYSYFYDVIIISDARFIEEISCVKDNFDNVTVIRINSDIESNLTDSEKKHITETALDNYNEYDYNIENNETVYELRNKIEEIIKEVDSYE